MGEAEVRWRFVARGASFDVARRSRSIPPYNRNAPSTKHRSTRSHGQEETEARCRTRRRTPRRRTRARRSSRRRRPMKACRSIRSARAFRRDARRRRRRSVRRRSAAGRCRRRSGRRGRAGLGRPTPTLEDRDAACEISPLTILEAMLFVGDPENAPITPQWVAGLMRGVRPAEIDAAVRELNDRYRAENRPYEIVSEGERLSARSCGRSSVRSATKSSAATRRFGCPHAAVEVLSVVAYHGSLTADEVNEAPRQAERRDPEATASPAVAPLGTPWRTCRGEEAKFVADAAVSRPLRPRRPRRPAARAGRRAAVVAGTLRVPPAALSSRNRDGRRIECDLLARIGLLSQFRADTARGACLLHCLPVVRPVCYTDPPSFDR